MRPAWTALLLTATLLALSGVSALPASGCSSGTPTWSTEKGNLKVNGKVFHLKGVNWFGFETDKKAPHGLWGAITSKESIAFFKQNGFNVVRLPFSADMPLNNPPTDVNPGNPEHGMSSMQAYEYIIDELGKSDILVLIDQHHLSKSITYLPTDEGWTVAKHKQSWSKMMAMANKKWNVMGVDIKNEPHGGATWSKSASDPANWNKFAEEMIRHIAGTGFKGLFFVEGIHDTAKIKDGCSMPSWAVPTSQEAYWWGGNLIGAYNCPIDPGSGLKSRVVYSPHVYGPDVYNQAYFQPSNFLSALSPFNKNGVWWRHFGFVEARTGNPVVAGEWGGKYGKGPRGQKDKQWQDGLSEWFRKNCMADQFYWDYNPNSGDTGGLVKDDWHTPETEKLALLARTQPHPTVLGSRGGKVCFVKEGAFADPACGNAQPSAGDSDDGGNDAGNSGNNQNQGNQNQNNNNNNNGGGSSNSGGGSGGSCGCLKITSADPGKWCPQCAGGTFKVKFENNCGGRAKFAVSASGRSGNPWNVDMAGNTWTYKWDARNGEFGFNYNNGQPSIQPLC